MIKRNVINQLKASGYQTFSTPTPLTTTQKTELKMFGATDSQIKKCVQIGPNVIYLHSICDSLVGAPHPTCNHVRYEFCTTVYNSFLLVTVMPHFEPLYSITLDNADIKKSSAAQISLCWRILLAQSDTDLLTIFTASALAKLRSGDKSAYTWHHDLQRGVMRLVSAADHCTCRHTGGNAIWSYGS